MNELPLETDVHAVKALLDEAADFLLLDCRQQEEHDLVSIEGDRLIPMDQLTERIDELADSRQRSIVVYCHLGGRSLMVTDWLRSIGFPRAQSMRGGIDAWATDIDTSKQRYQ